MNWLQKIAGIQLMYHGTSASKLPAILSEGLNTYHAAVWDQEKGRRQYERSLQSYGGTYFTNNFMTAVSAAGNAGEKFDKLRRSNGIIIAQLELRTPSILMDEDSLPHPMRAINTAFHINANDYWLTWWVSEGYPDIDKAIIQYFRELNFGTQYLTPYIEDYIKATAAREAAVACQRSRENNDWDRYHQKFPELDIGTDQADANVMNAANVLMQKMQDKANQNPDSWNNSVRILEPVTFRGKNKIVLIARMDEAPYVPPGGTQYIEGKYYVDIVLLYNKSQQAVDMLIKDATRSRSQDIRVRDEHGNVFYEHPKEKEHELVTTN